MPPQPTRLAQSVRAALLGGLLVSSLLLVVGVALVFASHEDRPAAMPEAGFELLRHALEGDGLALLHVGLLLLIITPALRVSILAVGWAIERDWIFTLVASSVLILLAISLVLSVG